MKKLYFPLLFTFALTLISCSEESDPEPLDRSAIIAGTDEAGKVWAITSITAVFGNTSPLSCVSDNLLFFYPNKSHEISEGREKCNLADPRSQEGTWSMNQLETELTINLPDSTQTWRIENLNQQTLELSGQFPEGNRTYVFTLR